MNKEVPKMRILILVLLLGGFAPAEDKADENIVDPAKAATMVRRRIAESAKAVIGDKKNKLTELKLHSAPIYKYHDVDRGFHHATTWMWRAKNGRPVALLNLSGSKLLYYEFISLSNEPVEMNVSGFKWGPRDGWKPQPIPNAKKPGKSRAIRLAQMRAMARKFAAFQIESSDLPLRLLPEPMYRYEKECDECLDGAIFAFVRDGDVETILTIEAANVGKEITWVFDCDRVSLMPQRVDYKKAKVWSVPQWKGNTKAANYYLRTREIADEVAKRTDNSSAAR